MDAEKEELILSLTREVLDSTIVPVGRKFDLDDVIGAVIESNPDLSDILDHIFDEEGQAFALKYLTENFEPAHIGNPTRIFKPY
ncbi:hypothetical protein NCHU2750_23660 [Neorhizobium sp. NCHU2750]|nr:hypothetical protein NCHU2750_23660 [Neorhizobium sp. NCHU2750]